MKILLCHNYYQQPGGEDECFAAEGRLLEGHGHEVVRFTRHNDAIDRMTGWETARRTLWNRQTYQELRHLIRRERPQIMHCTNTFPLISPAAYYAAKAEGVAVVQGLHNYRLFCANALFLRDGRVCEDCLGKAVPWPAVRYACYRDSRAATSVLTLLQVAHRALKTWTRAVTVYIALTEFARRKFIEGGLKAEQIQVKPNFVAPDPGPGRGRGGFAVYVGRLSPEKGIGTLLAAWSRLGEPVPLKIVGAGPLAEQVQAAVGRKPNIEWLGRLPMEQVLSLVGDAACLILPSICYETFGRSIIEAFAKGTPVLTSRMGAMAELVAHGCTGFHFEPGNAEDLAGKVRQLLANPLELARMRQAARQEYERKYTPETNYLLLMAIYERAIAVRGPRPAPGPVERSVLA